MRGVGGAGGDLHACVSHGDAPPAAGLRVLDAGEDGAGLGQQSTPEFGDDVEVEQVGDLLFEHRSVVGEGRGDVLAVEVHRQASPDVDAGDLPRPGTRVDLLREVDRGADSDGGPLEADALRSRVHVDLSQSGTRQIRFDHGFAGSGIGESDAELRRLGGGAQRPDRAGARLRIDPDPDPRLVGGRSPVRQ